MKRRNLVSFVVPLVLILPLGVVIAMLGGCKKPAPSAPAPYKLKVPLGLDQDYAKWIPADNPLTAAKIELGKKLYFDKRLSVDGTISCATCHSPEFGFSDGEAVSTGFKGQFGTRNAPTVFNRLYSKAQFWDGRAASLEEQALGPVQNPVEMASTLPAMVSNLDKVAGYKPEFMAAFGSEAITDERVAKAIAAYERTVLSGNSPFDRFQAGDTKAISESARRGFTLFAGRGNCSACHTLPNFTDEAYHNVGVGMDKPNPDLGRYLVTKNEKDRGAFKTPTLRDIVNTYPYLHDGSAETLEAVVEMLNRGGKRNPYLDAQIRPLRLTRQEKQDLVEFLESLTGEPLRIEEPVLPQ